MQLLSEFPGFRWFAFLKDASIRTGVYTGFCLSVIFAAWILIANRVPVLAPVAMERNIIAAASLALFACVPLIRFYRSPNELLLSGFLGWCLLTLTYRIFCFKFGLLEEYYSAFHVFVLGAVSYLVFATVSWIGTIIWRVHATSSHSHR
ncbi:MAG TPA: hypothetical protein VEJ47_03760 [Candidatus Eremiobacteraceae bacterium]|nr:hypothetical protein [Candidatus Eremiobacteraceae bacterium]